LYSFAIYIAAYSGYLFFSYFFGYNIYSLGGTIKLFFRLLWVVDAAYSAIIFFSSIEFSMRFIRLVAPLVFFVFYFVFPQKNLAPFFLIGPIQKNLFRMTEFTQKMKFFLGYQ